MGNFRLHFLWALVAALSTPPALAAPAASHLSDSKGILKRLDTVRTTDFSKVVTKTRLGFLLTEPIIRTLWAGQLVSRADWIGIQGLTSLHYRIDPGGADDASNMFVYTCRAGWIDMGHVIGSALAYKFFLQALRGNLLFNMASPSILEPADQALYKTVAKELSQGKWRKNEKGEWLSDDFWAGYFAIRSGIHIEELQTRDKIKKPMKNWDGNPTSAYTIEDLPSNFYGIQLGTHLERKVFVGGVVNAFKRETKKMLEQFGAVDLGQRVKVPGCLPTSDEVLHSDADYYTKLASTTYVPKNRNKVYGPKEVYNFTVRYKKTLNHHCVCDARDNPY